MKAILIGIVVLFLLFGMYSCEAWKYRECKKVGHSTTYCVFQTLEEK